MALIPRQCSHCGKDVWHYGACVCPEARLEMVDVERKQIAKRLEELEDVERDILGLVPNVESSVHRASADQLTAERSS